jgi:predicted metal-dependent hydrolase
MRHAAIVEGIEHFNAGRFWHAHESWESLWLRAAGEEKEFLRGLIQLAAAYHHVQRGTTSGAARLFVSALERLARSAPGTLAIERDMAERMARKHLDAIRRGERIDASELPKKLRYNEVSLRPDPEPHASEG